MHWIFQAIPKRYDLREKMKEGEREVWLVSRYRNQMKAGDIVFMWLAGRPEIRGLYGWGRITEKEPKYYEDWGHGIEISYERFFQEHVPSDLIKALPEFSGHMLLKMPMGTNFAIDDQQFTALVGLIEETLGSEAAPHG